MPRKAQHVSCSLVTQSKEHGGNAVHTAMSSSFSSATYSERHLLRASLGSPCAVHAPAVSPLPFALTFFILCLSRSLDFCSLPSTCSRPSLGLGARPLACADLSLLFCSLASTCSGPSPGIGSDRYGCAAWLFVFCSLASVCSGPSLGIGARPFDCAAWSFVFCRLASICSSLIEDLNTAEHRRIMQVFGSRKGKGAGDEGGGGRVGEGGRGKAACDEPVGLLSVLARTVARLCNRQPDTKASVQQYEKRTYHCMQRYDLRNMNICSFWQLVRFPQVSSLTQGAAGVE